MISYSLTHVANPALLQDLACDVTQDRTTTAWMLARIAEVDARKLYLPAAHASMFSFCVHEYQMSEDMAYKRIQAGRAARKFPAIFPMVADGRLHLTAVSMLAPRLMQDNVEELLAAAAGKSIAQLKLLLAERFPQPDVATILEPVAPVTATEHLAARPVEEFIPRLTAGPAAPPAEPNDAIQMEQLVSKPVVPSTGSLPAMQLGPLASKGKLSPLSLGRFSLPVTVDQETHDLIRHAQALLGHALPSGDIGELIKRAMRELVDRLEKRKCAATAWPRPQPGGAKGRHVPAEIRRTVWHRDGGRCTFVSDAGKRCDAHKRPEYDHVVPVARGGDTTAVNLRLRCRAHNQFTAECAFGAEFMRGKREQARRIAAETKARARASAKATAKTEATARAQAAAAPTSECDVIPWLRQLGFSLAEARGGAEACVHIPDASLEERVKVALRTLAPHCTRQSAPSAGRAMKEEQST